VTAIYSGDANCSSSTGSLLSGQTVNLAAVSLLLSSSANQVTAGSPVTFTATVTAASPSSGTPTGSVQFLVDGLPFGAPVTLSNGVTSLTTSSLPHGDHSITAEYLGDANFTT